MKEQPIVSIFIAAYNNPDYTRKTLQSIVEQTYRPIELVFSDDCSPTSLEPLIKEFHKYESADFTIHFFRQASNLRGTENMIFGFDHCKGKYVVNMPHDDWWTDRTFLLETVNLMENNPNCYLCAANSEVEKQNGTLMIKLPKNLNAKDKWQIIPGDKYVNLLGNKIGYQAYSALIFNRPMAQSLGAYHAPFVLSNVQGDELEIISDEFFTFQYLLASIGDIAITEKVVSIRGSPDTSFCNSTPEWGHVIGQSCFLAHYSIYKAELHGKYAKEIKERAKESLFTYPVEKINFKILRHYHYAPDAVCLMVLSFVNTFYYVKLFKHILRAVRKGELTKALINKHKKNGTRGLASTLFPFLKYFALRQWVKK